MTQTVAYADPLNVEHNIERASSTSHETRTRVTDRSAAKHTLREVTSRRLTKKNDSLPASQEVIVMKEHTIPQVPEQSLLKTA